MLPDISDEGIQEAELVLFGRSEVFDEERRTFIKELATADLQAVPGSGKTTALLAKLLIISRHLPFRDGSGILVLSHTNVAVNEIRRKIGHVVPQLFEYPNFVGTIQSFVDTFLAIPSFEQLFGCRPDVIDAETFNKQIEKVFSRSIPPSGMSFEENKLARAYVFSNRAILFDFRLGLSDQGAVIITVGSNENEADFKKPRRNQRGDADYSAGQKEILKKWFTVLRKEIWKRTKVIHYDDAYFLADLYLAEHPVVTKFLRKRFNCVFVDEMQDMDLRQVNLLDRAFYQGEDPCATFQRIGDKNQAIFSYDVKLEDVWNDRAKVLRLSRSKRLSKQIAKVVEPFALIPSAIEGDNEDSNQKGISPRIILYDDKTIKCVIPHFSNVIKHLLEANELPRDGLSKFTAIGWRKSSDDEQKITLQNYFPSFNSSLGQVGANKTCLDDCLRELSRALVPSKRISETIKDIVLRVLEAESISLEGHAFSPTRLEKHLRIVHEDAYQKYKVLLFRIERGIVQGDLSSAKVHVDSLLKLLVSTLKGTESLHADSIAFVEQTSEEVQFRSSAQVLENTHTNDGVNVKIGTVHSVKGETQAATLYLETFFHSDGGRSYESQRLMDQLKGIPISNNANKRTKQSSKVAYVGLSRPTHLLCFAAHQDRIKGNETALEQNGWLIDRTLVE